MEKETIRTQNGQTVEAMTPVILSASRSTDIPAYYAKWFMERVRKGYAAWINPFNQKPSYVSFSKTRVIVFWTKNPEPMLKYLDELDDMGLNYYFQFTLNDYGKVIEGKVPDLRKRLETFAKLYDHVGSKRIIWRYDPIMLNSTDLTVDAHLEKINNLGNQLSGMTDKLVFSFVDIRSYRKVQNNLTRLNLYTHANVLDAEPNIEQKNAIAKGISDLRAAWKKYMNWNVAVATCAEDIDLEKYGIEHNRCIDPDLIDDLFGQNDTALSSYLDSFKNKGRKEKKEAEQMDIFSIGNAESQSKEEKEDRFNYSRFKDKGQRPACGCVISKDIGMYNTCLHQCAYCYANTSYEAALNNRQNHEPTDEGIIPFKSI